METMKKFIFTDENTGKRYIIPLLSGIMDTNKLFESDAFNHIISPQVEKWEFIYGIHDWSTENRDEIIGYTSYEVQPEQINKLIEEWRILLVKAGYSIGKTKILSRRRKL